MANDVVPIAGTQKKNLVRATALQFLPTEPTGVLAVVVGVVAGVLGAVTTLAIAAVTFIFLFGILLLVSVGIAAVGMDAASRALLEEQDKTTKRHIAFLRSNTIELMRINDDDDGSDQEFVEILVKGERHPDIVASLADKIGRLHDQWLQARKTLDPDLAGKVVAAINVEGCAAAKKLIEDARQRYSIAQNERRTAIGRNASEIVSSFSAAAREIAGNGGAMPMLPPPSTTAALGRLTAIAERALAEAPDLADGTGARIDALVRKHLPRLAQRHADAAKGSADLHEIDAMLDAGVEEARASIEEALANDSDRRFDALSEEVAFLRARRGVEAL